MKNTIGFSARLLILNGLAVLAVILNHSSIFTFWANTGFEGTITPQVLERVGILAYSSLRVILQTITFAIPTFLFVSGYFIAFAIGRIEANRQWRIIFARIKNLFIPFLIWSVLLLILDMSLGHMYSIRDFLVTIIAGQARGPFYYIPLLIQFLILSPILVSISRKRYTMLLILTAIIQLIVVTSRYITLLKLNIPALQPILFLNRSEFFPVNLFFFTFGIVYGLHFSQFKQLLIRFRWGFLISLVFFFLLGIIEWEILQGYSGEVRIGEVDTHTDGFYAFAFILCFLAFEEFIPPFSKQLGLLGGMSFGIYITHWSVQEYTTKLIISFLPWLINYQILMQPILIVFGLGLPILLMNLVKNSPIRQYYRYLFG